MLCSDAKEIDPSDIEMKERLGAGQFGVSLSSQLADEFYNSLFCLYYSCVELTLGISHVNREVNFNLCLQCFDAVSWAAGRSSGL